MVAPSDKDMAKANKDMARLDKNLSNLSEKNKGKGGKEQPKPEEFKDTDVEDEYKENDKKGFRKQTGDTSKPKSENGGGGGDAGKKPNAPPSNDQLEKEQSQMKLTPHDLKDTDVEDEFKEKDGGAFRKNSGKARL